MTISCWSDRTLLHSMRRARLHQWSKTSNKTTRLSLSTTNSRYKSNSASSLSSRQCKQTAQIQHSKMHQLSHKHRCRYLGWLQKRWPSSFRVAWLSMRTTPCSNSRVRFRWEKAIMGSMWRLSATSLRSASVVQRITNQTRSLSTRWEIRDHQRS